MRILFIDPACPVPYDERSLVTGGLGGTEATVVRVASALGFLGHTVDIQQHNRQEVHHGLNQTKYVPVMQRHFLESWDAVVLLRDPAVLENVKRYYPKAKHVYLWLHDLPDERLRHHLDKINNVQPTIVCVSEFHKTGIGDKLKALSIPTFPKITRIYNPIDEDLDVDSTPVDTNKLVFISSPHKGLAQALKAFANARNFIPSLGLYVANPGYLPLPEIHQQNVHILGPLPHIDVMRHVREALCVFYPNTVFPETFGLVYAESNAVGTPVLTHGIGAAFEVLGGNTQLVDCLDPKRLIDKLVSWNDGGRPVVKANPAFRISTVAKEWERLFNLNRAG